MEVGKIVYEPKCKVNLYHSFPLWMISPCWAENRRLHLRAAMVKVVQQGINSQLQMTLQSWNSGGSTW